eukprot:TRINITY_DN39347_c0_g2_i1.p1 TRINITY_DN39347_c0_g2~~TRINITY_DN39347_c0_g2_i1.p1  ORF type:complete len:1038 (-),score=240.88 TRINITY_DN39347_c0_g2_i1:126-3239(-)
MAAAGLGRQIGFSVSAASGRPHEVGHAPADGSPVSSRPELTARAAATSSALPRPQFPQPSAAYSAAAGYGGMMPSSMGALGSAGSEKPTLAQPQRRELPSTGTLPRTTAVLRPGQPLPAPSLRPAPQADPGMETSPLVAGSSITSPLAAGSSRHLNLYPGPVWKQAPPGDQPPEPDAARPLHSADALSPPSSSSTGVRVVRQVRPSVDASPSAASSALPAQNTATTSNPVTFLEDGVESPRRSDVSPKFTALPQRRKLTQDLSSALRPSSEAADATGSTGAQRKEVYAKTTGGIADWKPPDDDMGAARLASKDSDRTPVMSMGSIGSGQARVVGYTCTDCGKGGFPTAEEAARHCRPTAVTSPQTFDEFSAMRTDVPEISVPEYLPATEPVWAEALDSGNGIDQEVADVSPAHADVAGLPMAQSLWAAPFWSVERTVSLGGNLNAAAEEIPLLAAYNRVSTAVEALNFKALDIPVGIFELGWCRVFHEGRRVYYCLFKESKAEDVGLVLQSLSSSRSASQTPFGSASGGTPLEAPRKAASVQQSRFFPTPMEERLDAARDAARERAAASTAASNPQDAGNSAPSSGLRLGALVQLHGLCYTSAQALEGARGSIIGKCDEDDFWIMDLDGGHGAKALHAQYIRVLDPSEAAEMAPAQGKADTGTTAEEGCLPSARMAPSSSLSAAATSTHTPLTATVMPSASSAPRSAVPHSFSPLETASASQSNEQPPPATSSAEVPASSAAAAATTEERSEESRTVLDLFAGAEVVARDKNGKATIARKVDTDTGKFVAHTFVLNEDGSHEVYGDNTITSLVDASDRRAKDWTSKLSTHQLRGLVHEMGQRLVEQSQIYHARQKELERLKDLLNLKFFGLSEGATEKELDAAYKALAKKMHPDKNGGTEEAKQRFQHMKERYEVLKKALKEGGGPEGSPKAEAGDEESTQGGALMDGEAPETDWSCAKRGDAYDEDEDEEKDDEEEKPKATVSYDPFDSDSMIEFLFHTIEQFRVIRPQQDRVSRETEKLMFQLRDSGMSSYICKT